MPTKVRSSWHNQKRRFILGLLKVHKNWKEGKGYGAYCCFARFETRELRTLHMVHRPVHESRETEKTEAAQRWRKWPENPRKETGKQKHGAHPGSPPTHAALSSSSSVFYVHLVLDNSLSGACTWNKVQTIGIGISNRHGFTSTDNYTNLFFPHFCCHFLFVWRCFFCLVAVDSHPSGGTGQGANLLGTGGLVPCAHQCMHRILRFEIILQLDSAGLSSLMSLLNTVHQCTCIISFH